MIASNLDLLLPPALIQACDLGADTDAVKSRIEQAKQAERDEIASTAAKEEARTTAVSAALVAGKSAFASQEYEEAERQFGIALINNAENRVDVLCNRAACSLKLKRYADAQADAAEAINFEPSSVKAHYRLACAYQGWGKLDSALRVCRAALELNPLSTQLTKVCSHHRASNCPLAKTAVLLAVYAQRYATRFLPPGCTDAGRARGGRKVSSTLPADATSGYRHQSRRQEHQHSQELEQAQDDGHSRATLRRRRRPRNAGCLGRTDRRQWEAVQLPVSGQLLRCSR